MTDRDPSSADLLPNFVFPQIEAEAGKPVPGWLRDNVPDLLLPWSIFAGPPPEPKGKRAEGEAAPGGQTSETVPR